MKKGINDISMIVNRLNEDYIHNKTSLTLRDATEILSLPLLGIVYEDALMIAANNRGVPVFFDEKCILRECFRRIARRLNGENVNFTTYHKKTFLQKLFQK